METMNARATAAQTLKLAALIFALVGLIFLLVGGFIYDREQADRKAMGEAVGVITGFHEGGYPYVSYEAEGETHWAILGYRSSSMRLGDEIPLYYDPRIPERVMARGPASLLLPGIFMGMGALFALLGGGILLRQRRLREEGESPWQN